MKGKWAAVSGYIEIKDTDALSRAYREIEEETGLKRKVLSLVRIGKSIEAFEIDKPEVIWNVHPFLFHADSSVIKLDREHEEYRWINPDSIDSFNTVPMLKEALLTVIEK